jgi:hypothetical protein
MSDGTTTRNWIGRLLPDLLHVFGRFPISALVSVGLWLFLVASIANGTSNSAWGHAQGLMTMFVAAGAGHLFAEGRRWSRIANALAAIATGAAARALYHFYLVFQTSELFLYPALLLILVLAPYLHKRADQAALWQFGLRLGLAMLLATIAGVVFGAGLSSIIVTVEYLLDVQMPYDAHRYIGFTALGLIGPLYGLSLVPTDLEDEIDIDDHRNTLLERGVSVLVNYVIVPLVVVYAVIIHAYAAKIAISMDLPRSEIGTIVCLFAAASVAAWIIAWPWREKGTWLLRQYTHFWFWLIPIPAVLLSIAIFRRISDYGVTPERYGLILVVIWTAILFVYLLIRRKSADLRAVIGVPAILLLLGSFGPWGAYGVTARDHFVRLKQVFADANLPVDGTLDVTSLKLTDTQKQSVYSAIDALGEVNGLGAVVALLPDKDKPKLPETRWDRWSLRNDLWSKLGVVNAWQAPTAIVFNVGGSIDIPVIGAARVIGPIHAGQAAIAAEQSKITLGQIETGLVKIKGPWGTGQVSSQAIIDAVTAAKATTPVGTPVLEIGNGHRIAITDVYGDSASPEPLSSVSFWLLLKQ